MDKKAIRYAVVDAFAAEPFKGNPAAVCLLEDEDVAADERWMQSVAAEFNLSDTAFLVRDSTRPAGTAARFHLRWLTPVTEVNLCGHATLASAHFLFKTVLAEHGMVEFMTRSGILTAKKVTTPGSTEEEQGKLFIELDFPMDNFVGCDTANNVPLIPETLNGASLVELSSAKEVADIVPSIDEIKRLDSRGLIVTGPAPAGSGYDFFTRFFCPKFGIDELHVLAPSDRNILTGPVTGSIHCVLAPYWGRKLGKQKLTAYQASPRGGTLYLELDNANGRVQIKGEAVTVMDGTLLA